MLVKGRFPTFLVTAVVLIVLALMGGAVTAPAPSHAGQGTEKIRVATYNICRPSVCPERGGPWLDRRRAIVRTIAAAKPHLLAVQEADDYDGTAAGLRAELGRIGYAQAPVGSDRCRPVACANHIFYRTDTFTHLAIGGSGSVRPSAFTPDHLYNDRVKDRPLGYALLEHRDTGRRVFAVSVHLPPQFKSDPARAAMAKKVRNKVGRRLPEWVDDHLAGVGGQNPVRVLLGDVNASPASEQRTPQRDWAKAGYRNAETARRTRNTHTGTIKLTARDRQWEGFPPAPRRYVGGGPKIDVIFTQNAPRALRYKVVLHLRRDGLFGKRYTGSDHNMVVAKIAITGG